jgi:hypothetical protein
MACIRDIRTRSVRSLGYGAVGWRRSHEANAGIRANITGESPDVNTRKRTRAVLVPSPPRISHWQRGHPAHAAPTTPETTSESVGFDGFGTNVLCIQNMATYSRLSDRMTSGMILLPDFAKARDHVYATTDASDCCFTHAWDNRRRGHDLSHRPSAGATPYHPIDRNELPLVHERRRNRHGRQF